MRPGILHIPVPCILLAAALLLACPAGATLVLAGTTLSPQGPLVPPQALSVDARISISPSGARTFATGHSLQMETDLASARWNTVVLLDGVPADRESGRGPVMFIGGYVLSYSTNRDVGLEVTVEGTVPGDKGPDITVLRVRELDNSGLPVAGSAILVTEPVSTPSTVPGVTTPVLSPSPSPPPSPAPTRAGGWIWFVSVAAAGAVGLARRRAG